MPKNCESCTRRAYYNYPNCSRKYCYIHKLHGMINLTKSYCKEDGCYKSRVYNYPGLAPAYCSLHRAIFMVNCNRKICKESDCIRFAQYGYNNRKDYCYTHKELMMDKHKNNSK